MVGRRGAAIGLARPGEPEPVYDRLVTVSLLHIMQMEPIVLGPYLLIGPTRRGGASIVLEPPMAPGGRFGTMTPDLNAPENPRPCDRKSFETISANGPSSRSASS